MANDNLGWWQTKPWTAERLARVRRVARSVHNAYHLALIHGGPTSAVAYGDRRLDLERAIAAAKAWCRNSFSDTEYGHAFAAIATRLPENWAKSPQRCALALRAFEVLCEDNLVHESGALAELAAELGRSTDAVQRDRLDFFVFAAACALDDKVWRYAMKEATHEGEVA